MTEEEYNNFFNEAFIEVDKYRDAKIPERPISSKLGKKYSMTQLQADPEFSKRANRFLTTIGEDDNIIEYLRDSDYSLTSAMQRASEIGNWSDQTKQDYIYLRDKYSKANLKGAGEWATFMKDFAIDAVADPLNVVTALFAIPSMGTSIAARTAAGELVKQGLKKYSTSQLTKVGLEAAKRPAIYGAAEGAGWNGAHEYFLQDQDIQLDLQPDNKNWANIGKAVGVGGLFGLGAGGTLGAVNGYRYLNKMQKYANEDDIRKTIKGKSVDDIVDEFEVNEAFKVKSPSKISKAKEIIDEKVVGALFGKSTTKFIEKAKSSETLTKLMQLFRYDFGESMFGGDTARVLTQSYGEAKGRRMGFYLARLDRSLNKLYRKGWSGKIDEVDNTALLTYIMNPRAKKFINEKTGEKLDIPDYVKEAGKEIRDLNKRMFDEGLSAGLFEESQEVANYFPRMFSYTKILNDREGFEKILVKSGHANPINKVQQRKTTETVEGVGVIEGLEENLVKSDKELFGRDFLKEANGNLKLAKEIKASVIVDNMLDNKHSPIEVRIDGGRGGGQTWLQSRVFNNIKDKDLVNYIETDVEQVLREYYTSAAQTVTRTEFFGRTVADFNKKFIKNNANKTGIYYELLDAGFSDTEVRKAIKKIRKLHERVTGLDYAGTQLGAVGQFGSNWGRLIQQMAHLGLATISSVSEPIILLQRAGISAAPQATRDMAAALGKNFVREIDRGLGTLVRTGISGVDAGLGKLGKGPTGIKLRGKGISKTLAETKVGKKISEKTGAKLNINDLDDETWFEIYETGLALEQAVMDRLEGLTGDALTSKSAQRIQNGFFKVNLLDQWTRTVQLASFTSGKRIITKNSEKLFEHYNGITNLYKNKVDYLEGQLRELGIDPKKAATWYANSLDDNFQFDINKASRTTFKGKDNSSQANFYRESVVGGANRFTKEVILNPSTAEANRPLWFSSPAGQLLMQFAGYPTVFTNTVLKRFAKDSGVVDIGRGAVNIAKGDFKAARANAARSFTKSPRTIGAAMTMTAVAVLGDYIRSRGKSIDASNLTFAELLQGENLPEEVENQIKLFVENVENKEDLKTIMEDSEIIFNAIRRWGGFGPFDYGARFGKEIEYNDNLLTSLAKAFSGPLPQDIIDEFRYGAGPISFAAKNAPGLAAYDLIFGEGTSKNLKKGARKIDQEVKDSLFGDDRLGYKTGGEVDVPQAPDEPDERIDKLTGLPYNQQAGTAFQDAEERLSFAEGKEVDNSQDDDGIKLFGKDGLIFDYTNPLDYLMVVPGAGILGIAGKSLSTAGKLSRLRKIPKTVYHGGRASVEKGTASRQGIYSTPDIKYAKTFATENRGFTQGAKGPAGVYQLDLRSAKNIELLDKPSKSLQKIVSAKMKELKNIPPNKITNYQQNLKDGLEFLFKKGKSVYVRGGGPTMVSQGTLNFLRKHGVEILSDSKAATHKLGKQSEFFLLKDFPKKRLSKEQVEKLVNAAKKRKQYKLKDADEYFGMDADEWLIRRNAFLRKKSFEGGPIADDLDEFLNEALIAASNEEERLGFFEGQEVDNSLRRLDGTKKSQVGWKGRIKNNVTGKIMTELSVGKPNTEEGFYPLINPYTTDKQIDFIQNFDFEKNNIFETKIGKQMNMNARKHYRESLEKNVSPFVNDK